MTPWSVSPSAGWSYAAARSASLSILQAPSRSEYSEWTCRWAQVLLTGRPRLGARPDEPAPSARACPHVAAMREDSARGDQLVPYDGGAGVSWRAAAIWVSSCCGV